MMKHLFLYPWIFAALVLGILFCLGTAIHLLMQFPAEAFIAPANSQLVKEVMHAAIL